MERITVLSKTGRLSSKMQRHLERGNLMTRHRLEENIRQSEIKTLENIIDKAFGIETEPRKVLTLKRKQQNDSANAIAKLIVQVIKNDEPQESVPSFNNCCISEVALYSTKHQNSKSTITARV
ncbi:transcriptional antitermination N peptide [Xenorhabdus sp. KK7.4]|uniref:transcriptional antitermination N peptide n=1 Tax=Xenorhabdus sp. KK7.4 TaxID=1851572 RepID=UPI000C04B291|nr:hypothetical protein [Xenorhabdus sp. KK7.4]PHM51500.1 hypothetical protein Xekk_03691 [Xenorhabdus sp. KK7.4]